MKFVCIGCGTEMAAVLGKTKEHHFRHKVVGDCCEETYLHRLTKRVLKHRFDTQPQFLVKYHVRNGCLFFDDCEFKEYSDWRLRSCPSKVLNTINLKEFYDTCEEEAFYGGFRADLMLSHSEHPERKPVFLEVSVTHDCTPEKINSKIRIIEIKIRNEQDAFVEIFENDGKFVPSHWFNKGRRYDSQLLRSPIRFYNFKREGGEVETHSLSRFYLRRYYNDICLGGCSYKDCRSAYSEPEHGVCFEITTPDNDQYHSGHLYDFGMALAHKRGFNVRSCILCTRYDDCCKRLYSWEKRLPAISSTTVSKWFALNYVSAKGLKALPSSYRCSRYQLSEDSCEKIIQSFENISYWEWQKT